MRTRTLVQPTNHALLSLRGCATRVDSQCRRNLGLVRVQYDFVHFDVTRFVRSIKEECLKRMIFVGQASLRGGVFQFIGDYHEERNHQ